MLIIPFATDRAAKRVPYATYSLIALNVLAYIGFLSIVPPDIHAQQAAFERFGFVPASGRWYSLVSAMFVHSGWLHLLGNLLFLWLFGSLLEDAVGAWLFLVLYLGGQLTATTLHAGMASVFHSPALAKPLIGASGAVSAILGLCALRFYRTKVKSWYFLIVRAGVVELPAWVFIAAYAGMWLLLGLRDLVSHSAGASGGANVAHWAHIGGFMFGLLAGAVLRLPVEGKDEYLLEELGDRGTTAEAGLRRLQELVRKHPQDPRAYHGLGKYLLQSQSAEEAGQHYMRAITLYLRGGDRAHAVQAYEELLNSFPNCVLCAADQLAVGVALEEAGKPLEASQALRRVAESYRESEEAEIALLRLGYIQLKRLHNPGKARHIFEQLIRDYPASRWAGIARTAMDQTEASARD